MGYFRILAAIPGFFVSALFLMLIWNAAAGQLGLTSVGYATAMLLNITLWLAVAPLVAASQFQCLGMFGMVPGFFLSSLFVMWLSGAITPRFDLAALDYPTAMLVTVTSWIAVGPLAFAGARWAGWRWSWKWPGS